MSQFTKRIARHVAHELAQARRFEGAGQSAASFAHLERAHVLGQASTFHHVRVHVQMLGWAWRHRVWKEARGQALRIVGAASKTAFGWIPTGNTGGANISPFKPLPVPDDLAERIAAAKRD